MTLIDFTLSNARRFYSSVANPLDMKGLSNLDHGDKKVTNSHILFLNTLQVNVCVCVRVFLLLFIFYIFHSPIQDTK